MLFAAVVAVLVSAAPAASSTTSPAAPAAVDPSAKGAELLERAKKAERELEYPQAKTILVELFSTAGVSEDALIEGHLLAGAIERVLENDTEARLHFLYVLRRRPAYVLAEDAPPKVRNFFELVREELKAEQKPEPTKAPETTPAPAPKETSLVGPIVAGLGGAVAVASLATAMVGESTFADAKADFKDREGGRTLALAGWTGAAIGVGVGVAGAVLWVSE